MTWTDCGAYQVTPVGVFCAWSRVASGGLRGNWSQSPVTLSTFSFGGAMIFRACGNWGPAGPVLRPGSAAFPSPVPHVRTSKFHDLDRDGVPDPGEEPLSGVTFRLVRESSLVGQPAQTVASTQSDSSGVVDFALDGQGPGRYYVQEDVPGGWTRTTADRQYVDVPFGIGADTLRAGDFGDVESTTDVAKVSFDLTDVPDHLQARTATPVTPDRQQSQLVTLDAGQTVTRHYAWQITCPGTGRAHTFTFTGRIAAAEPHITDTPDNDSTSAVWSPVDIKPNSDPNTINVGRNGVISVAVLGTQTFNPFTDLDASSLRFGPTGTQAPVVRCATQPEDVNGDGIGDMTCKFDNTATGFHVGDPYGYLTGRTTQASPYLGADAVRVIP
ncbi:MAG TPA: SdrD B-like domain-containing protein [Kineosporiaceae bacterium]|nr:SdrD B-like domain-containing protein [Kineosporiaceae bacterium]